MKYIGNLLTIILANMTRKNPGWGSAPDLMKRKISTKFTHFFSLKVFCDPHAEIFTLACNQRFSAQFSFQQILFQVAQLPIPIELTQIYLSKSF